MAARICQQHFCRRPHQAYGRPSSRIAVAEASLVPSNVLTHELDSKLTGMGVSQAAGLRLWPTRHR
jgi:hypothetical protein